MLDHRDGRNVCARSQPAVITLEFQPKPPIKDAQITVPPALDRIGSELQHLLGDDADVGLVAAVIAEAIEAEPVAKVAEQHHVVLEPDVGSPSAATAAAAEAAAAAHATAAAAHAAAAVQATTPSVNLPGGPAVGNIRPSVMTLARPGRSRRRVMALTTSALPVGAGAAAMGDMMTITGVATIAEVTLIAEVATIAEVALIA